MSVMFFTLPGNPRSASMLDAIAALRMLEVAADFEAVLSGSVPTMAEAGVGLFDHSLSLSGARSSSRHLGMYAPRLLEQQLGRSILLAQNWPQWVQELPYAVAVGEAAVDDTVVGNRARFILHTFTTGVRVNARKPGRLPWGQSIHTLCDPRCRFDWKLRRAGARKTLMGSC